MFDNIGNKIKKLATFITTIGITASIIVALFIIMNQSSLWVVAFLIAILGSLVSWLGSFLLYGYGELIDQATISNKKLQTVINKLATEQAKDKVRNELCYDEERD